MDVGVGERDGVDGGWVVVHDPEEVVVVAEEVEVGLGGLFPCRRRGVVVVAVGGGGGMREAEVGDGAEEGVGVVGGFLAVTPVSA